MIENLTLAQRVIKPHTIDPLEKHTVVVLERVGDAGEEFRFAIEPGQRVPKKWLTVILDLMRGRTQQDKYFAFAVTGDPDLRLHVPAPVKMNDHVHAMLLNIDIGYAVSEPRLVVISRRQDPVRKLREEAARLLQRDVAWRSWSSIREDFRGIGRDIVAVNRDALDRFAGQYGFRVHDLNVTCNIDDADIIDIKTEATVAVQSVVHRVTSDFERTKMVDDALTTELKDDQTHARNVRRTTQEHRLMALTEIQQLDRERVHAVVKGRRRLEDVYDAATQAAVKALGAAGDAIKTPAELAEAFQSFYSTVGNTRALMEGETVSDEMGSEMRPPARRISAGQSGAAAAVADMFNNTERMPVDVTTKHLLQSAILHLIAELMLNGSADAATIAQYSERVGDIRAEASLAAEHFDYLKRFADVERLRSALC